MTMGIDKAGRNHEIRAVEALYILREIKLSDRSDFIVLDKNIAGKRRAPGTVDDLAILKKPASLHWSLRRFKWKTGRSYRQQTQYYTLL